MTDYNKISIPRNYVLLLPDHDFTNYHIDGEESLSTGKVGLENVASHYSNRGKIIAVPDGLAFNLKAIQANKVPVAPDLEFDQMMFYFKTYQEETAGYKNGSVLFDTPIEVNPGDIAYFNYQEHYNCYDQGRYVETELGDMFLVKYDQLICAHPAGDEDKVIMLNGMLFVEPISVESVFGRNVIEKAGFKIALKHGQEMDFKKKLALGYVRMWGSPCAAYIDQPDLQDGDIEFQENQIVLYNPKLAPTLEFNLHKTIFGGTTLVKLRRRNIFAVLPADNELVEDLVTSLNVK